MKKIFGLILIMVLAMFSLSTAKVNGGFIIGPQLSYLTHTQTSERLSVMAGFFVEDSPLYDNGDSTLSLRHELLFVDKGADIPNTNASFSAKYLEINPFTLKFTPQYTQPALISFFAGPTFDILLDGKIYVKGYGFEEDVSTTRLMNSVAIGLTMGIELEKNDFISSLRYVPMLTPTWDEEYGDTDVHNGTFAWTLGFKF